MEAIFRADNVKPASNPIENGERVRNLLRDREMLDKRSALARVLELCGVRPILHRNICGAICQQIANPAFHSA